MSSLLEYAEKSGSGKCSICRLPLEILAEVDSAIRIGVGPTVICQWLAEEKDISRIPKHISHHKSARHFVQSEDT